MSKTTNEIYNIQLKQSLALFDKWYSQEEVNDEVLTCKNWNELQYKNLLQQLQKELKELFKKYGYNEEHKIIIDSVFNTFIKKTSERSDIKFKELK